MNTKFIAAIVALTAITLMLQAATSNVFAVVSTSRSGCGANPLCAIAVAIGSIAKTATCVSSSGCSVSVSTR